MNYRRIYIKIISNAKNEMKLGNRPDNYSKKKKFENQYFEFHHILPISLFPNWSKKEENIVALTAREHFFCHQLLLKIYPSREMAFAIYYMSMGKNKEKYKITSREYERIRKINSEARRGVNYRGDWHPTKEQIEKIRKTRAETISKMSKEERSEKFNGYDKTGKNNPFYGKTHTQETIDKIKKSRSETVSKMSESERKEYFGKGGEKRKGKNNPRARACILINTGEYFETIQEARNKYPMARHIPEACKANGGVAGSINGEKLRWKYAD